MRKLMVAGNWKMHGDRALAGELAAGSREAAAARPDVGLVLVPPYTLLAPSPTPWQPVAPADVSPC